MPSPFKITCYDKTFARTGWIGDPVAMEVTPAHNEIGTAKITLRYGHPKTALLWTRGARVVIEYDAGDGMDHLMSGPVRQKSALYDPAEGTITLTVEDDLRLLWRILGWPNPGNAIGSQTSLERKVTGPAETVAKTFISENATRLGLPVTVLPTHGWGNPVTITNRMLPLADKLFPAVENAGIGLRVYQENGTLKVDAYQPRVFTRTLTARSGVVLRAEVAETPPAATRTVIGDAGSGTTRVWRTRVNTEVEAEWGHDHIIEVLTDTTTTSTAEMDDAGQETLTNGQPKGGLSVELSETAAVRYGKQIRVGDVATLDVGLPDPVTDVLRRAALTWTAQEGLKVAPQIGERSDDVGRWLVTQIGGLWRRVRATATR